MRANELHCVDTRQCCGINLIPLSNLKNAVIFTCAYIQVALGPICYTTRISIPLTTATACRMQFVLSVLL